MRGAGGRLGNRNLLFLALTLIFVGYFMVWLPAEAAGLAFIGLEMGEEAKFLIRAGYALPSRSFFYVPPISLALMLALLTAEWPNRRWQTWAARGLAFLVSLLAFPAFEAIGTERAEWLWRLLLIAFVALVALLVGWLPSVDKRFNGRLLPLLLVLVALVGAVLPTWAALAMVDAFSVLLQRSLGLGPGAWLSLGGHLLVLITLLLAPKQKDDAPASSLRGS